MLKFVYLCHLRMLRERERERERARARESGHNIMVNVKRSKRTYVRKATECFASYFYVSSWSK